MIIRTAKSVAKAPTHEAPRESASPFAADRADALRRRAERERAAPLLPGAVMPPTPLTLTGHRITIGFDKGSVRCFTCGGSATVSGTDESCPACAGRGMVLKELLLPPAIPGGELARMTLLSPGTTPTVTPRTACLSCDGQGVILSGALDELGRWPMCEVCEDRGEMPAHPTLTTTTVPFTWCRVCAGVGAIQVNTSRSSGPEWLPCSHCGSTGNSP